MLTRGEGGGEGDLWQRMERTRKKNHWPEESGHQILYKHRQNQFPPSRESEGLEPNLGKRAARNTQGGSKRAMLANALILAVWAMAGRSRRSKGLKNNETLLKLGDRQAEIRRFRSALHFLELSLHGVYALLCLLVFFVLWSSFFLLLEPAHAAAAAFSFCSGNAFVWSWSGAAGGFAVFV